ncbi:HAD family hydrolase, partial [Chloroflexota bacterium]
MRRSYKLLVVDIDGTLIGKGREISDDDKGALSEAHNAGVQICLSTGRSLKSSWKIIDQLAVGKYHIFFDGALVGSSDLTEEIYVKHIDKAVVKQLVEFAYRHDMDIEFFFGNALFRPAGDMVHRGTLQVLRAGGSD